MNDFSPKTLSQIRMLRRPSWLIDGLLQANGTAMLYGPPGIGKTFLALDWSLSTCVGRPWFGRKVSKGRVAYIIAEGAFGISERIDAWLKDRNVDTKLVEGSFFAHDSAVILTNDGTVPAIVNWGKEYRTNLFVFDTLARCAGIDDENDAGQMNSVINAIDEIRDATGASILIIHHQGKNKSRGARGSSALEGAVDTVMSLDNDKRGLRLKVTKQRNASEAVFTGLYLDKVAIEPEKMSRVIARSLKAKTESPSVRDASQIIVEEDRPVIDAIVELLSNSKNPLNPNEITRQIKRKLPAGKCRTHKTVKKWLETGKVPDARNVKLTAKRFGWIIRERS